jgi:hypothetical protein
MVNVVVPINGVTDTNIVNDAALSVLLVELHTTCVFVVSTFVAY